MRKPRRKSPWSSLSLVALCALGLASVSSCRPFQDALQYCTEAPCAEGLECVDGVCLPPLPQPDPPPPCESAEDCAVDGNADGRICVEGECGWDECLLDVQCGTRICDEGQCAPRTLCIGDEDCKDGGVCIDGTCRSPCQSDDECGDGLLPETCLDGRCRQTCVADLLCFGGICEEGLCEEAECSGDDDCEAENNACEGGRCEPYTPCEEDEDCFDPDFLCNELGRCEPRPTCVTDAECGAAFLCIADVCRPADSCSTADECEDDEACIAGRCVNEPGCRQNADCEGGQLCAGGACADPAPVAPAYAVVQTAHGACLADGTGPCALVLYAGETAEVALGGFSAEDLPVEAALSASSSGPALTVSGEGGTAFLTAAEVGAASLVVSDGEGGAAHDALEVTVVDGSGPDPLRVLVVDGATGEPLEGAAVTAGDTMVATASSGLATFPAEPGPDALGVSALTVTMAGRTGVVVAGLSLAGNMRVVLPAPAPPEGEAAGVSGQVLSTGDEVGPVGYGVGLLAQPSVHAATLRRLFGPAYAGSLEAPLVGGVPVELPAAVMLEATLPFVMGNQVVRDRVYARTGAGLRTVTGFELRREVGDLFGSLFGAGELDLALSLAGDAEGMDVLVSPIGRVAGRPLVVDEQDLDGDGDVTELLPDWSELPSVEISPSRKPSERVGITAANAPGDARGEVFVVGGLLPAGLGFVPTGMATIGATGGVEQLRVAPPDAALSHARRALRLEAVFDDASQKSSLLYAGAAFGPDLDLGAFLAPPEGTLILDDVPTPGGHMLVLASSPGATTYAARVVSGAGEHLVLVPSTGAGGRSVPLPETLSGQLATVEVQALRRPGQGNDAATAALVLAGSGPVGDYREGAEAVATVSEPE